MFQLAFAPDIVGDVHVRGGVGMGLGVGLGVGGCSQHYQTRTITSIDCLHSFQLDKAFFSTLVELNRLFPKVGFRAVLRACLLAFQNEVIVFGRVLVEEAELCRAECRVAP